MLSIDVGEQEFFDERRSIFFTSKALTVNMQHSLISISKWESKWEKPYLSSAAGVHGFSMNYVEELDYIRCMIIGSHPSYIPFVLYQSYLDEIREYINKPHTATIITRRKQVQSSNKIVTSELIYAWMIDAGIDFDCDKWHLNRLLTLIDLVDIRQSKSSGNESKMSPLETAKHMQALNRKRRAAQKT